MNQYDKATKDLFKVVLEREAKQAKTIYESSSATDPENADRYKAMFEHTMLVLESIRIEADRYTNNQWFDTWKTFYRG